MHRTLPVALLILAAPAAAEERRAMISGFDRIRVDGPFEVVVTSGASPGATMIGEARALDTVTVRVSGTTLVVTAGINGWSGFPGAAKNLPRVAVTVPRLRAASLTGGGTLTIARMVGQKVEVALSGSGRIAIAAVEADRFEGVAIGTGALTVAGRAGSARFVSNGTAAIDASGFDTGTLAVAAQGDGDGRFAARTSADVSAQGQGRVTVIGSAACAVRGSAPVVCGKR